MQRYGGRRYMSQQVSEMTWVDFIWVFKRENLFTNIIYMKA